MPKKTNKDTLKKNLIQAMQNSRGVIKTACEIVGCSRQTYYDFMKGDTEFKNAIDDCKEIAYDFVVSKLYENIEKGKETSIIFFLKTQGKHKGWVEKTQWDLTSNDESINIPPISWVSPEHLKQQ